ncbi:hypothetical protein CMUS01_10469 [Colletotrichum musicola]|uniref:Uncharacterized protein n=1 Tax=Colletotrichum musicola TaxID=2175873 RepID=A0A8H6N8B7_9PEZI|nr:hypothetical protein CMUS01_10469 [Colletotrichum musicola]
MEQLSPAAQLLRDLGNPPGRPLRRRSTGDIRHAAHVLQARSSRLSTTQHGMSQNDGPDNDAAPMEDEPWVAELVDADRTATWRPWWLRTVVLSSFVAVFISFAIVFGTIIWYSEKHNGIFTAQAKGIEYVCRFILTAVLMLVAALWTRVELQACRYTPWYALYRSRLPNKVECDLDYTSMILPTLLWRSLKRKHYFLFLVAMISLLFKIQIVLSPGLLRVVDAEVSENSTLLLRDIFNLPQIYSVDYEITTATYHVARNIFDFNTSYPFGVTKEAAYQRFAERGTQTSPFTATVEALFMDFRCLKLKDYKVIDRIENNSTNELDFTLEMDFEGCRIAEWHIYNISHFASRSGDQYWIYNNTLSPEQRCSNIPRGRQFVYLIANFVSYIDNPGWPEQVSAIICGSSVRLSKAEVRDDGIVPALKEIENSHQTDFDLDIWGWILKSIPWTGDWWRLDLNWVNMRNSDNPVWSWQHFKSGTQTPDAADPDPLNSTDILYESVTGLADHLRLLFGHYRMRQERETHAFRETLAKVKKLTVNVPTAISMLSIFGLIVLTTALMIVHHRRYTRVLYMDPATLLGSLVFLHDHPTVTSRILDLQGETQLDSWPKDSSIPFTMRSWARIVFTTAALGIFAAVITTFEISQAQAGIGSPGGYWSISGVAASRLNARYDRPESFYDSMPAESMAVDWNLTPNTIQLRQNTWFADKSLRQTGSNYETAVSRLLIGRAEGDLPYPKGTYDKFLFPEIVMPSTSGKNISLELQLPAASLEPSCTRVTDETGDITIKSEMHNSTRLGEWTGYDAEILFDVTVPNGTTVSINETVYVGNSRTLEKQIFFAIGGTSSSTTRYYLWDGWSRETKEVFFLRGWHCNYIWIKTLMNVNMALVNSEWAIDQRRPPQPVDRTRTEPWTPPFSFRNSNSESSIWPDIEREFNETLDIYDELALLLRPYGTFAPKALGDPSQENNIKEAINHNWAFVRAQVANKNNRLDLNETAVLRNLLDEGLPPVNAKLIDHSRRRLFQSPVATYLILGILALVIIANILMLVPRVDGEIMRWKTDLFKMDMTGLAPDDFNSISRIVGLLHSSNAIQHMPSQALSDDELIQQLGHLRFRFGWFENQTDKTQHLTVGVEGDEGFVFLARGDLMSTATDSETRNSS